MNPQRFPYTQGFYKGGETEDQNAFHNKKIQRENLNERKPPIQPKRFGKRTSDQLSEVNESSVEGKKKKTSGGEQFVNLPIIKQSYADVVSKQSDFDATTVKSIDIDRKKGEDDSMKNGYSDSRADGYMTKGVFCIRRRETVLNDYVREIVNIYGKNSIEMVYQVSARRIEIIMRSRDDAINMSQKDIVVKNRNVKISMICPGPTKYNIKNIMPWLTKEEIINALSPYGSVTNQSIEYEYINENDLKIKTGTIQVTMTRKRNVIVPKYVPVKIGMDFHRWYIAPADVMCYNCGKYGHWMMHCEDDYNREMIDRRYREERGLRDLEMDDDRKMNVDVQCDQQEKGVQNRTDLTVLQDDGDISHDQNELPVNTQDTQLKTGDQNIQMGNIAIDDVTQGLGSGITTRQQIQDKDVQEDDEQLNVDGVGSAILDVSENEEMVDVITISKEQDDLFDSIENIIRKDLGDENEVVKPLFVSQNISEEKNDPPDKENPQTVGQFVDECVKTNEEFAAQMMVVGTEVVLMDRQELARGEGFNEDGEVLNDNTESFPPAGFVEVGEIEQRDADSMNDVSGELSEVDSVSEEDEQMEDDAESSGDNDEVTGGDTTGAQQDNAPYNSMDLVGDIKKNDDHEKKEERDREEEEGEEENEMPQEERSRRDIMRILKKGIVNRFKKARTYAVIDMQQYSSVVNETYIQTNRDYFEVEKMTLELNNFLVHIKRYEKNKGIKKLSLKKHLQKLNNIIETTREKKIKITRDGKKVIPECNSRMTQLIKTLDQAVAAKGDRKKFHTEFYKNVEIKYVKECLENQEILTFLMANGRLAQLHEFWIQMAQHKQYKDYDNDFHERVFCVLRGENED